MNNIFVSWKQKIESRIISDLKSQYTESEEQIRQRKEQFLKKQKKIILIEIIAGAVFLAFLIIRAAFLQDDILLSRNSFGQGSKEVQLSLKKDDKKKEITYKLDEQKLSAEEESKVYIQFFKKLKKIMMKNNTSLKQMQTPLNLPDTVDGYPFEITYELAEDGYIGSWTIDILPIIEGQPDVSQCKSLSLGTFTAIADINENLRQKFGEEANEVIIKDVMLHRKSAINQKYLTIIQDGLTVYADKIMNNLRSLKINFDLTQFVFIGGGASIIKNFSSDLGENMLIIEDVCINAKGYKDILEHKYKVVV